MLFKNQDLQKREAIIKDLEAKMQNMTEKVIEKVEKLHQNILLIMILIILKLIQINQKVNPRKIIQKIRINLLKLILMIKVMLWMLWMTLVMI